MIEHITCTVAYRTARGHIADDVQQRTTISDAERSRPLLPRFPVAPHRHGIAVDQKGCAGREVAGTVRRAMGDNPGVAGRLSGSQDRGKAAQRYSRKRVGGKDCRGTCSNGQGLGYLMSHANGSCLIDACTRETYSRGLCRGCYVAAQRRIRAGRTSWDQLIGWGLAQQAKTPKSNPLTLEMDRKLDRRLGN